MTKSNAARHQNGDFIFLLGFVTGQQDKAWDDYVVCHIRPESKIRTPAYCAGIPKDPPDKQPNTDGRYNIIPRALRITNDDRFGVNLSNKFRLHSSLDLTISGDFTREKLKRWNASEDVGSDRDQFTRGTHYHAPRAGTREQYNLAFNFNWTATSWLQLSAGYRYADYWVHDDKIAEQRAKRVDGWQVQPTIKQIRFTYREIMSDAEAAAYDAAMPDRYDEQINLIKNWFPHRLPAFLEKYPTVDDFINEGKIDGVRYATGPPKEIRMPYTGTHKGFAANNLF